MPSHPSLDYLDYQHWPQDTEQNFSKSIFFCLKRDSYWSLNTCSPAKYWKQASFSVIALMSSKCHQIVLEYHLWRQDQPNQTAKISINFANRWSFASKGLINDHFLEGDKTECLEEWRYLGPSLIVEHIVKISRKYRRLIESCVSSQKVFTNFAFLHQACKTKIHDYDKKVVLPLSSRILVLSVPE